MPLTFPESRASARGGMSGKRLIRPWPWRILVTALLLFSAPMVWHFRPLNSTERQWVGTWAMASRTARSPRVRGIAKPPSRARQPPHGSGIDSNGRRSSAGRTTTDAGVPLQNHAVAHHCPATDASLSAAVASSLFRAPLSPRTSDMRSVEISPRSVVLYDHETATFQRFAENFAACLRRFVEGQAEES